MAGDNHVLLVNIALGRELVHPIYHHLQYHHRNLLLNQIDDDRLYVVYLFTHRCPFPTGWLDKQTPLLTNQPMGIWDIYGW